MSALLLSLLLAEAPGAAPPPRLPDPAVLVRQLGSDEFEKRVEAERALLALGGRAVPAVEAGRAHPDLEVRRRCQAILRKIRAELCVGRVQALRAGRADDGVPLWDHYRRMFGGGRMAMALFADLYEKEWEAFDEAAAALRRRDHREASRVHNEQVERLTRGAPLKEVKRDGYERRELPPADHPRLPAALLVGTLPGVRLNDVGWRGLTLPL